MEKNDRIDYRTETEIRLLATALLSDSVEKIISAVKETLEVTLPELSADIMEKGVYLTGGGSSLKGLKDRIEAAIGIPVIIPEAPSDCVVRGTSIKLRRAK